MPRMTGQRKRCTGAVRWAVLLALSACPSPPPEPPARASLPLIVGMEYAFPGLAGELTGTRMPGVKFFPSLFNWGEMQATAESAIDFRLLDRLVKEYQDAGFSDCMVALHSKCPWGSVQGNPLAPDPNYAPKPEYQDEYAAWVQAVVERYDHDGVQDMDGLSRAIRYYEMGTEFSTYEPEPVAEYLGMLAMAYAAAHAAFADAIVMNAAFLTTTAFVHDPGPEEYEEAFAQVSARIMYHSLEDIRAVLDRPDLFDAVNFHALASPLEIEATAAWLRYEMGLRGYDKPLVISDTSPNPLIGWGAATVCNTLPQWMGLVLPPATEADRCRLADFFTLLIDNDQPTLDWTYGQVARDMAKMIVIAAGQNIAFLNTSFMEDFVQMQAPAFQAAAGLSAWGGMATTTFNLVTQEHIIQELRPLYYAIKQTVDRLDKSVLVERVETDDADVRLYRVWQTGSVIAPALWTAWYEPGALFLPGDEEPEVTLSLDVPAASVVVEELVSAANQPPLSYTVPASGGTVEVMLRSTPVFILPAGA